MKICDQKKLKYNVIPRLRSKASQTKHVGVHYNIAAMAFTKHGNFIGIAYNSHRDHLSNRKGAGKHAEQTLIHKYGKAIHTIYILRIGGKGDALPIHPCATCASIAKKCNIKIISLHEEVEGLID